MVQKQAIPNQAQSQAVSTKKPLQKTSVKKSQMQPVTKTQTQLNPAKKITPNMFGEKKKSPVTVKSVGILYYIFAGLIFLGGVALFTISSSLKDFLGGGFTNFVGITFWWVFPTIFVLLAVLFFFTARGIIKLKKWAKILGIIFAGLGFISSVYSLTRLEVIVVNVIVLVITGYILYALLIDKTSRQAFKN